MAKSIDDSQTVAAQLVGSISQNPRLFDRDMFKLAIPALGALIAEPLYVMADTAVVGRIGTSQLAGLSLASQIIATVTSISIFLAYGTTSIVARLLGANRQRDAARHAVQNLWVAVGSGLVLMAVCLAFGKTFLGWLNAPDLAAAYGYRYLAISTLGFPPMLVILAAVGYLRGSKDTIRPLLVTVCTAVLNLIVEMFLVFKMGYGIGASALSTVVVQWLGAGAYLYWIWKSVAKYKVALRPELGVLKSIGRTGFDLLIRTSALRATLLISTAVVARMGEAPLAAHEIVFATFMLVGLGMDAIAIAAQAMIGQLLGAKEFEAAHMACRRLLMWGLVVGAAVLVLVAASLPWLPHVFTKDLNVLQHVPAALIVLAVFSPISGIAFTLDGILMGAGDMAFLARAMLFAAAAFAVVIGVVIYFDLAMYSVWAAIGVLMATRSLTLYLRTRGSGWIAVSQQTI